MRAARKTEEKTISFKCPGCGHLCAFREKYIGRRARCWQCSTLFIIPDKEGGKAQKIKIEETDPDPLPGFFEAVFRKTLPVLFNRKSVTGLVFVLFLGIFNYYISGANWVISFYAQMVCRVVDIYIPLGLISSICLWAVMMWYYMQVIYETAFDVEHLPDIYMGGTVTLVINAFMAIYSFWLALAVSAGPYIGLQIAVEKISEPHIMLYILKYVFFVWAALTFPIIFINIAMVRRLFVALRPDYIIKPMLKAPKRYIFVSLCCAGVFVLACNIPSYDRSNPPSGEFFMLEVFLACFTQIAALSLARAMGLFVRHNNACTAW